jgi:arylsulfatase
LSPFGIGDEAVDVGEESGSPVTSDYAKNSGTHFSGQVTWVEFDAGTAADDQNHLISPEERLRVAMAKQ